MPLVSASSRWFFLLAGLACANFSLAQTKIWHFGQNVGLDFSQGAPTAISGPVYTDEGSAIVSDDSGAILFSTDGSNLYDVQGQIISSALRGHSSSTHSAIIIPHPKNPCQRFFVFTIGSSDSASFWRGVQVVEVISINGNVSVSASKKLLDFSAEKLAATPDGKGGFWLLAHDYDTAQVPKNSSELGRNFYSFHITANSSLGNLLPVRSMVGERHWGISSLSGNYWNSIGQMKFSSKSDKIALVLYDLRILEVLNFNKKTGRVTPHLKFDDFKTDYPDPQIYGVEFSPSGNKLFVSSGYADPGKSAYLLALDLSIPATFWIWKNREEVAKVPSSLSKRYPFGGLQMAPDGKIYIARRDELFVSSIENPDGPNYGFKNIAVSLPDSCQLSLPTILKIPDCAHGSNPCKDFSIKLPRDTMLCRNDSMQIGFPEQPNFRYKWSNGKTTSQIFAKAGEIYKLTVTNDSLGCSTNDNIQIDVLPELNELELPTDTTFCEGQNHQVAIEWNIPGVFVKWPDGSTGTEFTADLDGSNWVHIYTYCDSLFHFFETKSENCDCEILAASAFTPNNDGLNDHFQVAANCELSHFHLKIYNRWGEKVFESSDLNWSWDGKFENHSATVGVYIYNVEYQGVNDEIREASGSFALLR